MSTLGLVIGEEPGSESPLDAGLHDTTRRDLLRDRNAITLSNVLIEYARRMAYIAHRTDRSLFKDVCLAADLAQLLVERACVAEGLTFDEAVGSLIDAFKYQLQAQQRLYGYRQEDLDKGERAFAARFRQPELTLVYLRPLATSRRIYLPNSFGPAYEDLLATLTPIPPVLTLEGALHLAFMKVFRTEALGGPIDLLGMARPTAIFDSHATGLRAWQEAASLMIKFAAVVLVLLGESEGLLWEMSEIARQDAFAKLVLVTPPGRTVGHPQSSAVNGAQRMRELGFQMPSDLTRPGFLLFGPSGAVERTLGFDALWSGELLTVVSDRARGPSTDFGTG
jgi:hypothetical protein